MSRWYLVLRVFAVASVLLGTACAGTPEPDATFTMTEMVIRGPDEIPSGGSVWQVDNTGRAHHNLTICPGDVGTCDGESVVQRVLRKPEGARDPDSLPDETAALVLGETWSATIEVDLEPGRYRLYCAVPNHAPKGMDTAVDAV